MLVEYPFKADVPDDEVEPVSDHISPLSLEAFCLQYLLAETLDLACSYRFSLRTVLLKILGDIIIVNIVVNLLEGCK